MIDLDDYVLIYDPITNRCVSNFGVTPDRKGLMLEWVDVDVVKEFHSVCTKWKRVKSDVVVSNLLERVVYDTRTGRKYKSNVILDWVFVPYRVIVGEEVVHDIDWINTMTLNDAYAEHLNRINKEVWG